MQRVHDTGMAQVFLGDCRDLLRDLPPLGADLVITDPPWGVETHEGARRLHNGQVEALITFDSIAAEEIREIMALCARHASRWLLATIDYRHATDLARNPPEGWRWVRLGVWTKPNAAPQFSGDRPGTGWEAVAILHREGGRMHWNGGGLPAVWHMGKVDQRTSGHPTGKPIALYRWWIEQFGDGPGGLVLDPFAGAGGVLRAAQDMGYRSVGIEIDPRYIPTIQENLTQRSLMLDAIDGTSQERKDQDERTTSRLVLEVRGRDDDVPSPHPSRDT